MYIQLNVLKLPKLFTDTFIPIFPHCYSPSLQRPIKYLHESPEQSIPRAAILFTFLDIPLINCKVHDIMYKAKGVKIWTKKRFNLRYKKFLISWYYVSYFVGFPTLHCTIIINCTIIIHFMIRLSYTTL